MFYSLYSKWMFLCRFSSEREKSDRWVCQEQEGGCKGDAAELHQQAHEEDTSREKCVHSALHLSNMMHPSSMFNQKENNLLVVTLKI